MGDSNVPRRIRHVIVPIIEPPMRNGRLKEHEEPLVESLDPKEPPVEPPVEPLAHDSSARSGAGSRGSVNADVSGVVDVSDEVVKPVNVADEVVKPVNVAVSGVVDVSDDVVSPPRPLSNSKMVKPVP